MQAARARTARLPLPWRVMPIDRRMFFMAGASALASRAAPADQIRLGVIGAGGRGMLVMESFQKDPAVRVGAICDVYEPNLERGLSAAAKVPGNQPKAYRNYKQLLDDKDIDAVLIATPEHWHARMVLDALAAGKDVYVEKPLCQTPEQGVELVEAEKKSKSIVQVGMQRRSYDLYLEGREVVAAGTLGKVRMVRSWWLNNNLGGPAAAKLDGPLDWEQWQGPVKKRVPLDPYRFRHWREFSDYAGGIVADQGAHVYDGIHLLMNASYPLAVNASAGKPHAPRVDTPESVVVTAEYPRGFHRRLHHQLRGHALQTAQRPDESPGRRQGPHGHRPRRVQGLSCRAPRRRPRSRRSPPRASTAPPICTWRISWSACARARRPPRPCGWDSRPRWWCKWRTFRSRLGRRVKWNDALEESGVISMRNISAAADDRRLGRARRSPAAAAQRRAGPLHHLRLLQALSVDRRAGDVPSCAPASGTRASTSRCARAATCCRSAWPTTCPRPSRRSRRPA